MNWSKQMSEIEENIIQHSCKVAILHMWSRQSSNQPFHLFSKGSNFIHFSPLELDGELCLSDSKVSELVVQFKWLTFCLSWLQRKPALMSCPPPLQSDFCTCAYKPHHNLTVVPAHINLVTIWSWHLYTKTLSQADHGTCTHNICYNLIMVLSQINLIKIWSWHLYT